MSDFDCITNNASYVTDPNSDDTDGGGLLDIEEYIEGRTKWLIPITLL